MKVNETYSIEQEEREEQMRHEAIGLLFGDTVRGVTPEKFSEEFVSQVEAGIDWEKNGHHLTNLLLDILKDPCSKHFQDAVRLIGGTNQYDNPAVKLAGDMVVKSDQKQVKL